MRVQYHNCPFMDKDDFPSLDSITHRRLTTLLGESVCTHILHSGTHYFGADSLVAFEKWSKRAPLFANTNWIVVNVGRSRVDTIDFFGQGKPRKIITPSLLYFRSYDLKQLLQDPRGCEINVLCYRYLLPTFLNHLPMSSLTNL